FLKSKCPVVLGYCQRISSRATLRADSRFRVLAPIIFLEYLSVGRHKGRRVFRKFPEDLVPAIENAGRLAFRVGFSIAHCLPASALCVPCRSQPAMARSSLRG